ncbi:hypothetical protein [uncultured Methylibium sp.]|uniref:hypothetical protein n=1 Tax=uncultured Methylibium sp. TaxID=381093 RepID=UPI0025EF9850|nr:hypothetical protein [uncultured Methylibium sp.]
MKVPTNHATLLNAKALFGALHKLKLQYGNRPDTVCELFTAGGFLVLKTNTGDYKALAEGELWPPVSITMKRVKQLATIYAKSEGPVKFERLTTGLRVDSTLISIVPLER